MKKHTEIVAILAFIAAIGGVIATLTGYPMWGFMIELLTIPFVVMGLLVARAPRVGGGMLSIVALVIAVVGLGLAVLGMIGTLAF